MKFRILHYATLDSTNNCAKELASQGACQGTIVTADYQTKGRGRFKRKWVSPRGKDLLFSIIVRPKNLKAGSASILTQVVAHSVQEVLRKNLKVEAKIKKPNDVLVENRKICGILVESSTRLGMIEYMVVGVGLNVNSRKSQLVRGATSIFEILGKKTHLIKLLEAISGVFSSRLSDLGWAL